LIAMFFFSPSILIASSFCEGLLGAGTWRTTAASVSDNAKEAYNLEKLKAAIRAYVKFENSSSRAGGKGAQRLFARNWRELAKAAKAMNLSKDELEQLVAKEILRQAGARAESSRVVTQESIRRADQIRIQRAQIAVDVIDGKRAIFHRIEPGEFTMVHEYIGSGGRLFRSVHVNVKISKAFFLMATPVTQVLWLEVAELANRSNVGFEKFYGDEGLRPSFFRGDTKPVESVTSYDIQRWLGALNELSQAGVPSLADLIPDHRQGDVYGIPRMEEWEFVASSRGQFDSSYFFSNKDSQIDARAWVRRNSGEQTHPVAAKEPMVIDGLEFYDMIGNVWEMVVAADEYRASSPRVGIDPVTTRGSYPLFIGSSWKSGFVSGSVTMHFVHRHPTNPMNDLGFRLARSARSP